MHASDAGGPSSRYSVSSVIAGGICALILTVGISRFGYTPLLPIMREQAGLTAIQSGWLATINYVGYLGGALIAASLSRLESKFVLYRLGLGVAVLSTFAMGMTTHFWVWMLLRLVGGWSSTAGMLLCSGLVMNWFFRQNRRPELGLQFAGFGVGIMLSGLAVWLSTPWLHWNGQWYFLAGIGLLLAIPAWRWVPPPGPLAANRSGSASPLPDRRWMTVFIFAYFLGGFGYVITATFIVDIVRTMQGVQIPGNWVWMIMGAVAIPSCFGWDRLAARWGGVRALTLVYGLQTVSFALTAWDGQPAAILVGAVLFGATVIGTVSLTLSIVGQLYPANPAKAMARLTVAYSIAQIMGPIAAAYFTRSSGSFHGALFMATAVGAIGTLCNVSLCFRSKVV